MTQTEQTVESFSQLHLLLWGGGISLATSIATTILTSIIASIQASKRRKHDMGQEQGKRDYEADLDRRAEGRQRAEGLLPTIIGLEETVVGTRPPAGSDSFEIDADLIRRVKASSSLLPDDVLRESVYKAFAALGGLGPAEADLKASRYIVERTLVHHAYLLLTAYIRRDELPAASVGFIDEHHVIVKKAWETAEAAGETYEV
jgi:hypothetical protein